VFRNAHRAVHVGKLLPAFHRFAHGMRLFSELNRVIVAAIRPNSGPGCGIDPPPAQTVSKYWRSGLRHATRGASLRSEREGRACQAAISLARLWWGRSLARLRCGRRILGLPSPHHAARPLASEEMSPHLVMQAWEKHSVQHVSKAGRAARIGAIVRKWPGFPAKPDHGAPFLHYCVLFGHEHANFSIQTTASINACAGSPPKPANALGGTFLLMRFTTYEIYHIRFLSMRSVETSVLRNESFAGLERFN
jgi:hypothetical protein